MDYKKNNDDKWDPTDYEIYTLEDKPQQPIPQQAPPQQVITPEPAPGKPKKKKKSKNLVLIIAAIVAVAVIAVGAVLAVSRLSENSKKESISKEQSAQQESVPSTVRITFIEGGTVYQYADQLEKNGVCSKEDFYKAVNTPVDGMELTESADRVFLLEGYLFPDTYEFYKNEPADSVVKRFLDNYNSKVTDEMKAKAEALGYSMDQMLTLASIIQKECDYDINECRNVSSVFHNRLAASQDTYLGSDVTYFYLKDMADYIGGSESAEFDGYLMKYYTYANYRKGLPAGPVCNPGIKAIEAAVTPNETNYHFFLTDESGENFYYAETYDQHVQNGRLAGLEGF